MSDRILQATYLKDDKLSMVTKATRWGTFTGVAKCTDEDTDIAHEFTGCHFAEYKCDIQSQKKKVKYYHDRYDGINMAYNNLRQAYDTSDPVMVALYRQRNLAYRDYKKEQAKYRSMYQSYKDYVAVVLKAHKDIAEKFNQGKDE